MDLRNVRTIGGRGGDGCIGFSQVWCNDRAGKHIIYNLKFFALFNSVIIFYSIFQAVTEAMEVLYIPLISFSSTIKSIHPFR